MASDLVGIKLKEDYVKQRDYRKVNTQMCIELSEKIRMLTIVCLVDMSMSMLLN